MAWRVKKFEVLNLLLSSALAATPTSHVFCRWTVTTWRSWQAPAWPALLGWLSDPAGVTLDDSLAGFACPARGESRA